VEVDRARLASLRLLLLCLVVDAMPWLGVLRELDDLLLLLLLLLPSPTVSLD